MTPEEAPRGRRTRRDRRSIGALRRRGARLLERRGVADALRDAEALLEHVTGLSRLELVTSHSELVDDDGLLPPEQVQEIRSWLDSLAADSTARAAVVKQTLDGAVRSLSRRTHDIADAAGDQLTMAMRLREVQPITTRSASHSWA